MAGSTIWAPVGDKGPDGDKGPTGDQGPVGPVGGPGPDAATFLAFQQKLAKKSSEDLTGGTNLVGGASRVIDSMAQLKTFAGQFNGDKCYLVSWEAGWAAFAIARPLGGGNFVWNATSTATSDDATVVAVTGVATGRWLRDYASNVRPEWFGARRDGVTDDNVALQASFNLAAALSSNVKLSVGQYRTSGTMIKTGGFKSFGVIGAGTGDHTTSPNSGSVIVTSSIQPAFNVTFTEYANENFKIKGVNLYSLPQTRDLAFEAIKLTKANTSGRYISGFTYEDLSINGYGAGFNIQGMYTDNVLNNYWGDFVLRQIRIYNCGAAFKISNAVMNLMSWYDTIFFDCNVGGLVLNRDGAVGAGLGKGSAVILSMFKCHGEAVAGLFRTQLTSTTDNTGTKIRSSISLYDYTHEVCGATVTAGTPSGAPYQCGVDTDFKFHGFIDYGLAYKEVALPDIGPNCTISSVTPFKCQLTASSKVLTPTTVNAPRITKTLPASGSVNFTIQGSVASEQFGIKSNILIANGALGLMYNLHTGTLGGAHTNTPLGTSGAGIAITYNTPGSSDLVNVTVANTTAFTFPVEFVTENTSGANISTNSSYLS